MQAELGTIARNLALTLDCGSEDVERRIRELAIMMDTGMEVNEMDLHAFLGEPEADCYTRSAGPFESQKI